MYGKKINISVTHVTSASSVANKALNSIFSECILKNVEVISEVSTIFKQKMNESVKYH